MDERLQIIFSRRSIRAYTGEPVSEADITNLLQAGMAAPSAMNRQPWHLVAVTDKEALQALADAISRGGTLPDAGLAIVVCGDPSVSDFWPSDCGAASENILVAAAGLGLGSLWMGCQGRADREVPIRQILDIPDGIKVMSVLAIGHPAEGKEARTQYDAAKAHRNQW